MAFKIALKPTYAWPITVSIAVDGGKFEASSFTIVFRRKTVDELRDLYNPETDKPALSMKQVCEQIIENWSDLIDDENKPVPFTSATCDALLAIPGVAAVIATEHLKSNVGAREKN